MRWVGRHVLYIAHNGITGVVGAVALVMVFLVGMAIQAVVVV